MHAPDPGAFEAVVLGDRMTWHRATLQEWINMLDHLKRRQQQLEQEPPGAKAPGPPKPAMSGRSKKSRYPDPIGMRAQMSRDGEDLTAWEVRFLKVSKDIDEAYAASRRAKSLEGVSLWIEWLLALERDASVANWRKEQRDLERGAIAQSSSRRLRYRRHPYYPGALELVHIAMVCQIVVERTLQGYRDFCNESGELSRAQTTSARGLDEFLCSDAGRSEVIGLFADLRLRGYRLACSEEECLVWLKAHKHLFEKTWRLTRALLAYIFNVAPATIRKDLSPGRLNALYAEMGIDRSLRVHHERTKVASVARLYRRGWSERPVNGRPDPRDEGTTYGLRKKSQ